MIDLKLKQLQAGFFDRDEVLRRLGKAKAAVLRESGRLVRKAAQASLRYGDRPSRPGSPPTAHKSGFRKRTSKSTGQTRVRRVSYLREFIYFAYDKQRGSVFVGPSKLNAVVSKTALTALEFGGPSIVAERDYSSDRRRMKTRSIRVKARPFMRPALEAERPNFAALWKDSIR